MNNQNIPGYTFGSNSVPPSPLNEKDLELLKQTILIGDEDIRYLRMAGDVLADQVDAILDLWYGFVGSHPHLLYYFHDEKNKPNSDYLAAVRLRFGQWIRDVCAANYDSQWLNYQYEIALRHTRARKNKTDNVRSASDHIPLRYLIAFIYPITATMKSFLAAKGHSAEEVEKMHQAWFKSVVLHVTLWSLPYAKEGDF